MKMILHVMLKDLKRHWPEVAGFILFTSGRSWQEAHPDPWIRIHAAAAFPILLFVVWFILIVRVVQGESLVGDREFWQTRPYRWWQLLLEKSLLLILFLNGPLLLAQLYLLLDSGLPFSTAWIPGLLWIQLQFAVYFILPAVAFATITPSIVQWILTLIGVGVAYFVISWLPWNLLPTTLSNTENLASLLGIVVIGALLLALVVWQFARRNVWRSRIIAAVAVLAAPLCFVFASTTMARNFAYPKSGNDPLRLAFVENNGRSYERSNSIYSVTIKLPVKAQGLSANSVVIVEGFRVHFTGDGGWSWDSKWMNRNLRFSSKLEKQDLEVVLSESEANELKERHATAAVELALALYQLGPEQQVQTASEDFEIPGVGRCVWLNKNYQECVAPLRSPDILLMHIDSGSSTCADRSDGSSLPTGHTATNFQFDESPFPADFDINLVRKLNLDSGFVWDPPIPDPRNSQHNEEVSVCRGTPYNFRTGKLSSRMQISTALGNIGSEVVSTDRTETQIVGFKPKAE